MAANPGVGLLLLIRWVDDSHFPGDLFYVDDDLRRVGGCGDRVRPRGHSGSDEVQPAIKDRQVRRIGRINDEKLSPLGWLLEERGRIAQREAITDGQRVRGGKQRDGRIVTRKG